MDCWVGGGLWRGLGATAGVGSAGEDDEDGRGNLVGMRVMVGRCQLICGDPGRSGELGAFVVMEGEVGTGLFEFSLN